MSRSPDRYPTSAFDYELPPARIARFPAQRRDQSRLLVLRRDSGLIEHRSFHDLIDLIPPGDALVLNETRVFRARLIGRRATGGAAEVLLLRPVPAEGEHAWEALVRPGSKLKPGRFVDISSDLRVEILREAEDGARIVRLHTPLPVHDAIERHGRVPLPPYIDREADEADLERYQTVYARHAGSVAAPTAGLHFTTEMLQQLEQRGVHIVYITLHVGVGTFRPVEVEDPGLHPMHDESYEVSIEAAAALNATRNNGGKVWAVGTTVTRTLESVATADGTMHAGSGATKLFIRPSYGFKAVDHLITNFHLPRSTLLMLVTALGGYEPVMDAYREAIKHDYRFYSYGDAMAIV